LISPWLLRQMGKRIQKSFGQNPHTKVPRNPANRAAPQDKKVGKNVGEYVEYEEIKE
jgi:hypothetical protein